MASRSEWIRIQGRSNSGAGRTLKACVPGIQFGCFLMSSTFLSFATFSSKPVATSWDVNTKSIKIWIGECTAIDVSTKEMEDFVIRDASSEPPSIYLTIRHPPRLFVVEDASEDLEFAARIGQILGKEFTIDQKTISVCRTICLQFESDNTGLRILDSIVDFCLSAEKNCFEVHIASVTSSPIDCQSLLRHSRHKNSWEVNLAWLCLASSSGFIANRFTPQFFQRLDDYSANAAINVLYGMTHLMNRELFLDPTTAFEQALKGSYTTRDLEDTKRHSRVARVIITPTRMIFYEPDIMQNNRVLREWREETSFIRVCIRDENLHKLSLVGGRMTRILPLIMTRLKDGFEIGDHSFKFLGCSSNQVRDHGCYFVDTSRHPNIVEMIRSWAGNLDGIQNVAKYVARLGQVFSTSTQTITVDENECVLIPDVIRNGFCFTDGIGKISYNLAEKVTHQLERGCTVVPSAFQIRFGGCKGVVAVDMNVEKDYPGKRLLYRESMVKYWSSHTMFEVLSVIARPQELYLNQQMILLLSFMGIQDRVFMNLLNEALTNLFKMFVDEDVAKSKIKSIDCGIDASLYKKSRIRVTTEPYLRSLLMALYKLQMKTLREKSRIPIDPNKARVLLGTVDETSTLEYGQVFIQISKELYNPGIDRQIITQKVVICKSPALHPGDLRTFQAVDCVGLHHIFDCIVFPSKGDRPHPNELSGSDLDGDLYHVIWDEQLVPTVPNKEAMDYSALPLQTHNTSVTTDDILFFLQQVRSVGTHSRDCVLQNIQEGKVSQAVDAPKTGQWKNIPRSIRKLLVKYPDFMAKKDRPSYPSEKVLGMMYRNCNLFLDTSSFYKIPQAGLDPEHKESWSKIEGMEPFLDSARKLRTCYNAQLSQLMDMYGIRTEAEFMSGMVESFHEKIGKEVRDMGTLISSLRTKLIEKFRALFFKDETIQENGNVIKDKAIQKAATWRYVCYSDNEICEAYVVNGIQARFLSFAWVPYEYHFEHLESNDDSGTSLGPKAIIERSLYGTIKSEAHHLFRSFQTQLQFKEYMDSILRDTPFSFALSGMSYTFLFDVNDPQIELVLWFEGMEHFVHNMIALEKHHQNELINQVRSILLSNGFECRIIRRGKNQLLQFSFNEGKNKGVIAFDPLCWIQSGLILAYITRFPWLFPLLRVLIHWARKAELTGPFKSAAMDSPMLCFLFIDFCISNQTISTTIDYAEVIYSIIKGQYEAFSNPETLTMILNHLFSRTESNTRIGALLMSFFSEASTNSNANAVQTCFQEVLGCSYYAKLCSPMSMTLLMDEMHRALHKLAFHCSVDALFLPVKTEKVLHLPVHYARRMIGSEQYFSRLFSRLTKTSVEIHSRGDKEGGLLILVTGTNSAMQRLEITLQSFKTRADIQDRTENVFPGPMELFVKNAYKQIVEGIPDLQNQNVVLEDYNGFRHPVDDSMSLYVIHILEPTESIPAALYDMEASKFIEFRTFFLEKMQMVINHVYTGFKHGPLKLQIQFGKLYVVSPPKALIERPEGFSLEQLFHDGNSKPTIQNPLRWDEELRQMKKEDSAALYDQTRMSFFSNVNYFISKTVLEKLLVDELGLHPTHQIHQFEVSLRGKSHGINAVYNPNMILTSLTYLPIHWMQTDVKRHFQERNEVDIRFDLSSCQSCKNPEVLNVLSTALRPDPKRGALIETDLLKSVNTLKNVRLQEFQWKNNEASLFWNCTTVQLSEVVVFSRPRMDFADFLSKESYLTFHLDINLDAFLTQFPPDVFIGEMWFQTLWFSDRLQQLIQGEP